MPKSLEHVLYLICLQLSAEWIVQRYSSPSMSSKMYHQKSLSYHSRLRCRRFRQSLKSHKNAAEPNAALIARKRAIDTLIRS
jgi:hypothetical protein